MRFFGINFLLILIMAGLLNLLVKEGWPRLRKTAPSVQMTVIGIALLVPLIGSRQFQIAWLFFKTGLLSFGGAYASLVFVQQGAVAQHHWLTDGQLLDGVALSVATPGPFMLFTTFVGYLAGGVIGAIVATFFVFLPSFVFVLGGAHYVEKVRDNKSLQAFLAGVSAAVVGIIAVVSLLQGMNTYVAETIMSEVGAGTFKVEKVGFVTDEDEQNRRWRMNPNVTMLDARAIERFNPSVIDAVMAEVGSGAKLAFADNTLENTRVRAPVRRSITYC